MFRFLKNLLKNKNEDSKSFRYEMAKHLDGRHIRYVTERLEEVDVILGREGALILKGDELLVYAASDVLFRAKVSELKASELLSLDGAILTAPDLEHNGVVRTVIAYYKYYR